MSGSSRSIGIRKCGKGVYEINFRLGKGFKRYQKRVAAASLSEARKIRIKKMEEYLTSANSGNADKRNVSFDILRSRLIRDLESDSLRAKTIVRCLNTFDLFFRGFIPLKYPDIRIVDEITLECIYEYKNFVTVDRRRYTGWRAELGTLKGIIARLTKLGYCSRDLKESLKEMKKPPCVPVSYTELTDADKAELLEYIKDDKPSYYGISVFLVRLGWRINETLSIKRRNIGYEGRLPVSIKLEAAFRKNKQDFILESLDDELVGIINHYMAIAPECQWLFPNSRGNKIKDDHYRSYLAEVSKIVIGKRITPHYFRRSVVTESMLDGRPLKDIMAITGHTDLEVLLKHYSFSTAQGRRKVLDSTKVRRVNGGESGGING